MKRKSLVLMVFLLTLQLVLPSCSSAQDKQESTDSTANSTAEPRTLSVVVSKPSVIEDMNTNAVSLWLAKETEIEVNYDQISGDGVGEKVALMLAGGDLPDIFLNCGITSSQLNQYGIQDEVLIPLDDLIEANAPNLKQAMEPFERGFDLIREVDGHIYSLPTINPCFHCSRSLKMWLNDEWMQKLGLTYPETTEDFYNVLKAFRDDDPNGNSSQDEIPLAGSIDGWRTQSEEFLINSFLPFTGSQHGFILDDQKNVKNALGDERMREAFRYLNKLYNEGLFYEGSISQKNDQLRKLVENPDAPIVGAVTGGYGGQFVTELGSDRYRMYRPLAPLEGPEGVRYAVSSLETPTTGAFVVTSQCKDPALAVEWGDAFYLTSTTATMFNGLEGTAWRYAEEGEVDFNGEPALWTALISYGGDVGSTRNDVWTQMGIYNFSAQWREGQTVDPQTDLWSADGMEYMLHKVTQELYDPYNCDEFILPALKLTDEEFDRVSVIRTEWENHYKEVMFNFISGAWNLEGDWDSHVASLDSTYSMNTMLEIYQTAFDRMYAE